MTMHRRPLGHGRTLAAIAGVLLVVACVLPWWKVGGQTGVPALGGNGFDGSGFAVFLVGVAVIALLTLPYAAGDGPVSLDRWLSYLILALVGWVALAIRVIGLASDGAFSFGEPVQVFTNGPGLWLAFIGLIVLSRATWSMSREPAYR